VVADNSVLIPFDHQAGDGGRHGCHNVALDQVSAASYIDRRSRVPHNPVATARANLHALLADGTVTGDHVTALVLQQP
jgi:hypothetical protein